MAAAEELALGQALADGRTATTNAVDNALPPTTTDLLAEWERALGIVVSPGLAIATRRATILAHIRAAGGSPQRILASVETLAGGTCALAEWLATDVTPDPRQVFRFGVGVPSFVKRPDTATNRAQLRQRVVAGLTRDDRIEDVPQVEIDRVQLAGGQSALRVTPTIVRNRKEQRLRPLTFTERA